MKKLVLMLILISIGFVYAQEDEYYQSENDEHTSDNTVDEIVGSSPVILDTITGTSNDTEDTTPEQDMTVSAQMYLNEYSKKISVPLWYIGMNLVLMR